MPENIQSFPVGTNTSYYRARYYDPNVGRFGSIDPIGYIGGPNLYGYGWNNPIRRTDPRGTDPNGCNDCPSGKWSGTGINFGGILGIVGAYTGFYRIQCWGNNLSCVVMVTCDGSGLGLGGSISAESYWVSNAHTIGSLAGSSDGYIGGGGAGIVAVGGSYGGPYPDPGKINPTTGKSYGGPNPSNSTSHSGGAGFGLGGGGIGASCTTSVLSCTRQ